ncbi:histidine kinase famiy protein [Xylophilus sp. GOD-11R]|uniref:histidine kinase famiy protein n=1 Tax=Xylophilus sp. GOD-11R TaxID=3089814 RepID=UPI00298CDA98|nr:histidine kinase famiy protein [Xylophilus sp. GOD-11R]WPB55842.1 histidine kinase famiy protein [Xylophilus sp. GOD-11R]
MAIDEKPPIRGSHAPEVSEQGSLASSIQEHRDDIFFAAIETTRMPMLVTDPRQADNPIVFSNRAFASMTGYTAEEVIGTNCRFLQGPDTDRAKVAAIREAIANRREITVEILNYRKDGSSFWNALYISPVYNRNKELVFFFASQLDVSRRRDAEESLAQAQKMEALGQLTGGISHDFNNLLQVMSGHVDLLMASADRGQATPERVKRIGSNMRSAVSKAATLTQQLLAFSRKQRLEGRVVNLNAVIRSLSDLVERTFGGTVELNTVFASGLDNCRLDTVQLELAILNVLVNARDAMPDGGRITLKTGNQRVETEDHRHFPDLAPGDYVCISITDTGSGIPPEIVSRVMDPFFTTKEEGKGTGLGLSMVYGFTKQSGGATHLYSEVGIGTTVRLYFPATKDVLHADKQVVPRDPDLGGDETILVVDDRHEVAELSRDMLEGLGYRVYVANGGKEALELVDGPALDQAPDLLFSDIIMPGGMNGFVLARELQARLPGIKVILTTGYASTGDTGEREQSHEFEILKKPYRLSELARKVRRVLDLQSAST